MHPEVLELIIKSGVSHAHPSCLLLKVIQGTLVAFITRKHVVSQNTFQVCLEGCVCVRSMCVYYEMFRTHSEAIASNYVRSRNPYF